jgi:glycerol uptake facilitator-like aquaporin
MVALSRKVISECVGTAFLLATVVGSGIMGERLAGEMLRLPC